MTLATIGLGALCAAPITLLLGLRWARLQRGMDRKARRLLGLRSAAFAAASLVAATALVALRGSLAAPALVEVLAVLVTVLLLSSLLGGRDRH